MRKQMFHPEAIGGGAVEIIAFLNGIKVHRTLSIKNLVAKFSANVLSVGSGLPTAVQGPLITYGSVVLQIYFAIIGAGIGQFQSKPRMFTTDGVAAGVSAGFHSPIGGLLFAMEDLSSFWSKRLSWQTFFCSVVATSVAQMFNTAFSYFKITRPFGYFFMSVGRAFWWGFGEEGVSLEACLLVI
ncbi:hypothetical protein HELRODRAFT_88226 [Helobdella robusta]|uniref:Uncharacterized protein n=1 Tax=Helobdella robusta TaxID=6412 RepID=T1G702_HELRO|nr:hypothetical protein HELRODRAFT_88226 [Helobdella robusta]ESN93765.1 hypothetical protein HELRODRAFT_88226 [Helobdella robusta]